MGILNVRLSEEDDTAIRALRARGVSISAFVREAIRAEAAKARTTEVQDVHRVIGEMLKLFPAGTATEIVPTLIAVDRRKMQAAIRARLKRPR